jgi:outer membrane protein OmpA-like peptidoglycan-associated protein
LLFLKDIPMRLRTLLLFYFISCMVPAYGQMLPKAKNYYDNALVYKSRRQDEKAIRYMAKAIRTYPAFTDAYSALGSWYFQARRYNEAITTFRAAISSTPNGRKTFNMSLARCLVYGGHTTEALQLLNELPFQGEAQRLKTQAAFIQQAMNRPWRDTVFNMGRVNTPDAEMYPWISTDQQTIYLTRRIRNSDEDFYKARVDSCGGWFAARNMGSPPNTLNQEAAQMISGDGHYLFFTQCENRSESGWAQGGCDLYMSYTADSIWSVPQSFGGTINTPAYEGTPCLSPDNRELYFSSDRPGGFGGLDLWVSRFVDGLWQAPVNLGPAINTPLNESAPFLHIDNNTLYFSSNGQPGMGGSDLYMCRRVADTNWTAPVNMGYPINTTADENSLCISVDGKKLYFASDRDSLEGNFDLYDMRLPDQLQPVPVSVVKGYVYDSLTGNRLNYASIYVKDAAAPEKVYHFLSNRGDGSFMITLPLGKKYYWHTDRVSFQDGDDTLFVGDQVAEEPMMYNIPLLPQGYVAPVHDSLILTILFPKNSAKLSDSDRVMINAALAPWLDQAAGLVVYVNGYTDNSGSPIINEQLSYMRAGLVAKEIISLGILELNLHSKGWGEADPVAPNTSEDEMGKNRRVEVIIRR